MSDVILYWADFKHCEMNAVKHVHLQWPLQYVLPCDHISREGVAVHEPLPKKWKLSFYFSLCNNYEEELLYRLYILCIKSLLLLSGCVCKISYIFREDFFTKVADHLQWIFVVLVGLCSDIKDVQMVSGYPTLVSGAVLPPLVSLRYCNAVPIYTSSLCVGYSAV